MEKIERKPNLPAPLIFTQDKQDEIIDWINDSDQPLREIVEEINKIKSWLNDHDERNAKARSRLDDLAGEREHMAEELEQETTQVQPLCLKCNHSCKVWGEGCTMTKCGHYDGPTREDLTRVAEKSIEQELEAGLERLKWVGEVCTHIYLPREKYEKFCDELSDINLTSLFVVDTKTGTIIWHDIPVYKADIDEIDYCTD